MESLVVERIKKINWLYSFVGLLKAGAKKRQYNRVKLHYSSKKRIGSFQYLLETRSGNSLRRIQRDSRDLNIFFLGTDKMQDQSGILQSLGRLGNLEYFTRKNGVYGQEHPESFDNVPIENAKRLWEIFEELNRQGKTPDILIGQTWRCYIDGTVFSKIRRKFGTFVINIAMDDRHQFLGKRKSYGWSGTFGIIQHIDLALVAARECVVWYLKEGCPALFFPEASDPNIFHPFQEIEKIHDVSFVGRAYGIRRKTIKTLESSGVRVVCYGDGWTNGRISTELVPKLFAQSKIILGVGTIGHSHDFFALKLRDFDAPMSGSTYLTHSNPDLKDLYKVGKEILVYKNMSDCIKQVHHLLSHDGLWKSVGKAGRCRALLEHTWDKRFENLFFNVLKLIDRRNYVKGKRNYSNI